MKYESFLQSKRREMSPIGFECGDLSPYLKAFQNDIVRLSLKVGRFCIWADTGLGKGLMALSWADAVVRHTSGNVLILAPLGVAKQFEREEKKFGITAQFVESESDVKPGISTTNYEKLHKFDLSKFSGIVVDESSCIKNRTGFTHDEIIQRSRIVPYRLACSATPSPNDLMELGSQCEFVGAMDYHEMLAEFFTHDGGDTSKWILKPHAEQKFWQFVCTWAVMLRKPSDLGYSDDGYDLPAFKTNQHTVDTPVESPTDVLVWHQAEGLADQRRVRKESLIDRCNVAAKIVSESDDQFLIWCETNDEQALMEKLIGDRAVSIQGSTAEGKRLDLESQWRQGEVQCLITKPSIFGHGMNWQHCHRAIYLGCTHSFEMWHQTKARLHRFGQQHQVTFDLIQHQLEGAIASNLRRKQIEADRMALSMLSHMAATNREMIQGVARVSNEYVPRIEMYIPSWCAAA